MSSTHIKARLGKGICNLKAEKMEIGECLELADS